MPPADGDSPFQPDADIDLSLSRTFIVKGSDFETFQLLTQASFSGAATDASRPRPLPAGMVIDSNYRILSLLGEGGMGAVYRARHERLDKDVALKTFRSAQTDEEAWMRFEQEARAIARLAHKNIVQVFDFGVLARGTAAARPFYTMEILHGCSLAAYIEDGALNLQQTLEIFLQVADGLAYAHKLGVIHRDIKPDNIFICTPAAKDAAPSPRAGTVLFDGVKIVDFGIAKLALAGGSGVDGSRQNQSVTRLGLIFGSPLYMSPEQSMGDVTDGRTDIYSFGCALFEALTGRPPFVGKTAFATICGHQSQAPPRLADIRPGGMPASNENQVGTANIAGNAFPQRLEALVARLLQKEPSHRYQDFSEVRAELDEVLAGLKRGPELRSRAAADTPLPVDSIAQSTPFGARFFVAGASGLFVVVSLVVAAFFLAKTSFVAHPGRQGIGSPVDSSSSSSEKGDSADSPSSALTRIEPYLIERSRNSKKFFFPQSEPIGYISEYGKDKMKPAQGIVEIKSRFCEFLAEKPVSLDASLLEGFAADDLQSVKFDDWQFNDKHIEAISHLSAIFQLDLENCHLTPAAIPFLNRLSRLHRLEINACGVDALSWSRLATLPRLTRLGLTELNPASPLLQKLKEQNSLTSLTINVCDITDDDLTSIAAFDKLTYLYFFYDANITSKGIKKLFPLRNLKKLFIEGVHVKPDVIDALVALPALTKVNIDTSQWSAADEERLKKAMALKHCTYTKLATPPDKSKWEDM
ncbi:MAG: protein kinase [Cyanobacteria bacterium REEB67]|nr:protein kinase [Cyanobacteria bacterium REEB67]